MNVIPEEHAKDVRVLLYSTGSPTDFLQRSYPLVSLFSNEEMSNGRICRDRFAFAFGICRSVAISRSLQVVMTISEGNLGI